MCLFFFVGESSGTSSGPSTRIRFTDGGVLGRVGIFNMMEPGGGCTTSGARLIKGKSTADDSTDDAGS
jgi:hypothetical protein